MSEKRLVKLDIEEVQATVEFQKKCLMAFAEIFNGYTEQKSISMFSLGISVVISNIMGTFGIENIELFADDIKSNVLKLHKTIQENSVYMDKNGKKVSKVELN